MQSKPGYFVELEKLSPRLTGLQRLMTLMPILLLGIILHTFGSKKDINLTVIDLTFPVYSLINQSYKLFWKSPLLVREKVWYGFWSSDRSSELIMTQKLRKKFDR